jgi:hydroxyquinol 1,2-dioxygenase
VTPATFKIPQPMRNFDENTITGAVLERFENAKAARVRQISGALVRHLHAFIREIEPSFDEWREAIAFLTAVGKKCSDTRQEFILLSDTLGASMLVDAINHRLPKGATETTVLGPFFVENAPQMNLGGDIAPGAPGEPLFVEGSVSAVGGGPLPGATIDVWHSDKEGYYDVQHYDEGGITTMRARFHADARGRFWFWTIVPSFYPIPDDGPVGDMLRAQGRHPFRPAHIHFMISAPGYETLVTHVFIDGDKYLDSDVVFGVKDSLIRKLECRPAGAEAAGKQVDRPFAVMTYDFALAPSGGG